MKLNAPVLVVLDHPDDTSGDSAATLVARAERFAADAGTEVVVAVIGPADPAAWASPTVGSKTTAVHVVEHPALEHGDADAVAHAAVHLAGTTGAGIVFLHDDSASRAVAGSLAVALDAPVVSQCVDLDGSSERLRITRRAYEGAVLEHVDVDSPRAILTVEDGPPVERGDATPAAVHRSDGGLGEFRTRVSVSRGAALEGPSLRSARRIVAVGGGIHDDDDFQAIEQLARALDAVVAGSKPTVTRGWVGPQGKVGLTGTTVTPDVYLALGISGASQHMAGCKRAGMLIAVNVDRRAPIFRYARVGVVADANEIVRALLNELGPAVR